MADKQLTSLTEKELSERLTKETINHPLTLSSGVSTILAGTASWLFFTSDFGLMLLGLCGGALTLGLGFVLHRNFIGKHKAMLKIIEKVHSETRLKREQVSSSVREGLTEFNEKGAIHQLDQLKSKFETFSRVLNLQFDADEFAHKRYLTTAEQLYFGAVDNLRNYMVQRHSVSAINIEHINGQLREQQLEAKARQALEKRKEIYAQAQQEMKEILSINEQVMTKIDDVTSNLGAIQTREGLSGIGLDTAMQEIQLLISRTEKYDISRG